MTIDWQVRRLISRRKRVQMCVLHSRTRLVEELRFDAVDLVDVILELERFFHLVIPDEVQLHTVGDLVIYVRAHHPAPCFA